MSDAIFRPVPQSVANSIAQAAAEIEQQSPIPQEDNPESVYDVPVTNDDSARTGIDEVGEVDEVVENASGLGDLGQSVHPEDLYDASVGGVMQEGVEYLAFYKSFRFVNARPARGRWGIFFIKRRCAAVAADMQFSTGESFSSCLDVLMRFLYAHELYHYRFDAHCIQIESTGGYPLYRKYRAVVQKTRIDDWHEESIANFYGLKNLRPSKGIAFSPAAISYVEDLVRYSPGAYADALDSRRQSFRKEQMCAQAMPLPITAGKPQMKNALESILRIGVNMSIAREPSLGTFFSLRRCPVYWIDWVRGSKSIITPLTVALSEVGDHFIKRYLGGRFDHQGDHAYYRIDNGELVKFPNSHDKDIRRYELNNILAKAGMTGPLFHSERMRTNKWKINVPRDPSVRPRV